jgi:hypothetical protein
MKTPNPIEVMRLHGQPSGFAPAGVTYQPRDDAAACVPLLERLVEVARVLATNAGLVVSGDLDPQELDAGVDAVWAALVPFIDVEALIIAQAPVVDLPLAAADPGAVRDGLPVTPGVIPQDVRLDPLAGYVSLRSAFLQVFSLVVTAGYGLLDQAHAQPDDDWDPEEVRDQLANAIAETCDALDLHEPIGATAAEWTGAITDAVLDVWGGLNEFLIRTTDAHLRDEPEESDDA